MKVDEKLYTSVHELALQLANAADEDADEYERLYRHLEKLCIDTTSGDSRHPFFLETLADFTPSDELALEIYDDALELATAFELDDYTASIYLAMSYRYSELKNNDAAIECAEIAQKIASGLQDSGLREEIEEQLQTSRSAA